MLGVFHLLLVWRSRLGQRRQQAPHRPQQQQRRRREHWSRTWQWRQGWRNHRIWNERIRTTCTNHNRLLRSGRYSRCHSNRHRSWIACGATGPAIGTAACPVGCHATTDQHAAPAVAASIAIRSHPELSSGIHPKSIAASVLFVVIGFISFGGFCAISSYQSHSNASKHTFAIAQLSAQQQFGIAFTHGGFERLHAGNDVDIISSSSSIGNDDDNSDNDDVNTCWGI
mmetsp:Transcript_10937/g.31363  ORF Transcript_10937/g.31363 Transcript_10937/m.31363 type:complete len:227 (-) Transcript_10937:208-888(-)